MFERMHSRVRKVFALSRVDDGRVIRNAILLLSSYALCVSSNMLLMLVLELMAHKEPAQDNPAATVLLAWVNRAWLVLLPVITMLLELLLLRLQVRFGRVLFAFFCFALTCYVAGALYTKKENNDSWIYLQTALAWVAAISGYIWGPSANRPPSREVQYRSWIYCFVAIIGLLRWAGYF